MRKHWIDNLRWVTVLLVPGTVGLFVFQWMTGYFNTLVAGRGARPQTAASPIP